MTCPWCRNGNLRSISEGTNINGTNWRVYRCTNYTAGCQYSWVVSFNDEESITRQFKEMNRKSRLYISANDLERLRLENPNADCGVTAPFAPMPPSPPPPPEPRIANDIDSLDDLPFSIMWMIKRINTDSYATIIIT